MKNFLLHTLTIGSLILFVGCTTKVKEYPHPDADLKKKIEKNSINNYKGNVSSKKIIPYQQKVSLLVGSRSNDSKVIISAGKVLRIYIASYKLNTTLIASHDIYTYVEKPGFVVGENLPERSTNGITTPLSKLPYKINAGELNIITSEEEMSNEDVKNFNNNMYQKRYGYETRKLFSGYKKKVMKQNKSITKKVEIIKKIEDKRDASILDYIKNKKKENR